MVVFRDGDEEKDCGYVLEAMYPLLTLRTLTADIEHAVCEIADDECGLGDTSGLDTGAEDVLIVGNIVWCGNAIDRVKVAAEIRIRDAE